MPARALAREASVCAAMAVRVARLSVKKIMKLDSVGVDRLQSMKLISDQVHRRRSVELDYVELCKISVGDIAAIPEHVVWSIG